MPQLDRSHPSATSPIGHRQRPGGVRRRALTTAASGLAGVCLLTAVPSPAEAASHALQCGPKAVFGKLSVQACAERVDGTLWTDDHLKLSVRLWNNATSSRTATYEPRWRDEGHDWLRPNPWPAPITVPAGSSVRYTYRTIDVDNDHDVDHWARVTYGTTGGWSGYSTTVSVGD